MLDMHATLKKAQGLTDDIVQLSKEFTVSMPAVDKACEFTKLFSDRGSDDVLLTFFKGKVKDDTVAWNPKTQYLHQVFHQLGKSVYEFDLKYDTVEDGERRKLLPTKEDVERFLGLRNDKMPLQLLVFYKVSRFDAAIEMCDNIFSKLSEKFSCVPSIVDNTSANWEYQEERTENGKTTRSESSGTWTGSKVRK